MSIQHPRIYQLATGVLAPLSNSDFRKPVNKDLVQEIQSRLCDYWLLINPDGNWGNRSDKALALFKQFRNIKEPGIGINTARAMINIKSSLLIDNFLLNGNWASRTVMWMSHYGYNIAQNKGEINICYFFGLNLDGTWNSNEPFVFNDRRVVMQVINGVPTFVGNWLATANPGEYYWDHPMNSEGCASIRSGQYKAWNTGDHKGQDALVQSGIITVLRGPDQVPDTGDSFAIDHHSVEPGGDYSYGDPIGAWSAGCSVGASRDEHDNQFMPLVHNDPREQKDPGTYQHYATYIPGNDFLDMFAIAGN